MTVEQPAADVATVTPDGATGKSVGGGSDELRPATSHLMHAEGLSKSFHGRQVLTSVDFTLNAGEIAVLIGKSGSGKSTLLRIIAGLTKPDAGNLDMMGDPVITDGEYEKPWRTARAQIGMIFQSYTLWPHMNVRENLSLAPRKVLNESSAQITERAERALAEVGMAHHLNSRCTQLSGGERQRVAIARALMMRPKLLLCDEMTSALDPPVAAEVLSVITKLKDDEGIACILVTHDMAFAAKAADRVAFFENGVIAEEGDPRKLLMDPETEGLRNFVNAVRF